jgi:hypothetical protein
MYHAADRCSAAQHHACVRACARACVHVCVYACVRVCVRVQAPILAADGIPDDLSRRSVGFTPN